MEREKKRKVSIKLFISALYLSALTSGGGYMIVTLTRKKSANGHHWIGGGEMLDLITTTQFSPGVIAANGAIAAGYKLAGMAGVLTTTIATTLPLFVIISLLSVVYNLVRDNLVVSQMLEEMQAGVGVVTMTVTYEIGYGTVYGRNAASTMIVAGAFTTTCLFNVSVIYVAIICGLIGMARALLAGRRGREV